MKDLGSARPSVGTPCADCKFKGHRCWATAYKNGVPVCAECASGKPCKRDPEAPQRAAALAEVPKPVRTRAAPARPAEALDDDAAEPLCLRMPRAKRMIAGGMSQSAVCKETKISRSTFQRYKKELQGDGIAVADAANHRVQRALQGAVAASTAAMEEHRDRVPQVAHRLPPTVEEADDPAIYAWDAPEAEVSESPSVSVSKSPSVAPDGWIEGYVSAVPNHRVGSVYDRVMQRLSALVKGKEIHRTFETEDAAKIFARGVSARGIVVKMSISYKLVGATVYLWRKA